MPERLECFKQFLRSAPPPERHGVVEGGVVAKRGLVDARPPPDAARRSEGRESCRVAVTARPEVP
eukprot:1110523-Alexandrium_andersonii.AAC.1